MTARPDLVGVNSFFPSTLYTVYLYSSWQNLTLLQATRNMKVIHLNFCGCHCDLRPSLGVDKTGSCPRATGWWQQQRAILLVLEETRAVPVWAATLSWATRLCFSSADVTVLRPSGVPFSTYHSHKQSNTEARTELLLGGVDGTEKLCYGSLHGGGNGNEETIPGTEILQSPAGLVRKQSSIEIPSIFMHSLQLLIAL